MSICQHFMYYKMSANQHFVYVKMSMYQHFVVFFSRGSRSCRPA